MRVSNYKAGMRLGFQAVFIKEKDEAISVDDIIIREGDCIKSGSE